MLQELNLLPLDYHSNALPNELNMYVCLQSQETAKSRLVSIRLIKALISNAGIEPANPSQNKSA